MEAVPAVAVKLLWNLATGLSAKFITRSRMLRDVGVELEAQRKRSQRQEEMAALRAPAANLRRMAVGVTAPLPSLTPPQAPSAAPAAAASAELGASTGGGEGTRKPIRASPSWEAAFSEGLSTFARMDKRARRARGATVPASASVANLSMA